MIGERIRILRQAYGISQVELAQSLNVSKQSISNWENNNILPSIDMLKKIAFHFSCSADYLLGLNDNHQLLEVTGLTIEQISHIQNLIKDLQILNAKIESSPTKDTDILR